MRFSCYQDDLNDALQFVMRAVAVKPQTPVLAGVYIKSEGSVLEVQGNNYAVGIIVRIPVSTEDDGEIVVNGKKLQEFVRNMPGRTINVFEEENTLVMESGGASVRLSTMDVQEFPKVKTPEAEMSFKVQSIALHDLLRKTVFAAAGNEGTRPIFTGCCFEVRDELISIVATNTHRLALAKGILSATYNEVSFVVPAVTLRDIMNRINLNDRDHFATINCSTRFVTFTFDNAIVTARLIEGLFPPYDRVIPTSSMTRVIVETQKFKEAIEFVALMAKETEYNTVKLVFNNEAVEVSSDSPEIGDAVKIIDAHIEGDDLEIAFNAAYIVDVLKVIDTEKVELTFNDPFSPAAIFEPGNDNYIYIATPVRT